MTVYFSGGSRGAGDPPPPPYFSTKMRPEGLKKFFLEAAPSPALSQGLDDPPTPLPIPSTVQCRIISRETLSQTHKLSEVFQKKLHGQQVERTIITILTQQRLEVVLL